MSDLELDRGLRRKHAAELVFFIAMPNVLDMAIRRVNLLDELDEAIGNWIAKAPLSSFDLLVAMIGNPSAEALYRRMSVEKWDGAIEQVLSEWARLQPKDLLPRLTTLLENPGTRTVGAFAISGAISPDVAIYIQPFLKEIATFTDDEITFLIDALGDNPGNSTQGMLRDIQQRVPLEREMVHKELAFFLKVEEEPE